MRGPKIQFSGPTLRPISKWVAAFVVIGLCALLLELGLSSGFPNWLKWVGWTAEILYVLGGSLYLILRTKKDHRQRWGLASLFRPDMVPWVLGQHARKPKR